MAKVQWLYVPGDLFAHLVRFNPGYVPSDFGCDRLFMRKELFTATTAIPKEVELCDTCLDKATCESCNEQIDTWHLKNDWDDYTCSMKCARALK